MTFEFNLIYALWAIGGLILGLLLGRAIWRRPVVARVAETSASTAALAAARSDAERRGHELATSQAAMRPLADEVDRLKRELARSSRPIIEPLPAMTPMAPMEPMAGTGPIVVAAPDIRQLKGVGDKFAAALGAIGLGGIDRIARLTPDEALDADTRLGAFNGRIARDQLVEQATLLDEGRTTEYEARFGKLGAPVLS